MTPIIYNEKTNISVNISEEFSAKLWNEYSSMFVDNPYSHFLQYLQHNIDNNICWSAWNGIGLTYVTIHFKDEMHITWFLLKYSEELN